MYVLCVLNVCDRNDSQLTDVLGSRCWLSITHTMCVDEYGLHCMIALRNDSTVT